MREAGEGRVKLAQERSGGTHCCACICALVFFQRPVPIRSVKANEAKEAASRSALAGLAGKQPIGS